MIDLQIFEHYRKGELPNEFEKNLNIVIQRANDELMKSGDMGKYCEGAACRRPLTIELNLMQNNQIQKINKKLRNIDKATDVISLNLFDNKTPINNGAPHNLNSPLGEIYISIEKCKTQAKEIGNTFIEELQFLLIHGVLHIFGYDHKTKKEEETMMSFAYKILNRY